MSSAFLEACLSFFLKHEDGSIVWLYHSLLNPLSMDGDVGSCCVFSPLTITNNASAYNNEGFFSGSGVKNPPAMQEL